MDEMVEVLESGILASLEVSGDVEVRITSIGGVAIVGNRRLAGVAVEFEIIVKAKESTTVRDDLVTTAIGKLTTAIEGGSCLSHIKQAATAKGGSAESGMTSATVDTTSFTAPTESDVTKESYVEVLDVSGDSSKRAMSLSVAAVAGIVEVFLM